VAKAVNAQDDQQIAGQKLLPKKSAFVVLRTRARLSAR
jgi:hypothetical protein